MVSWWMDGWMWFPGGWVWMCRACGFLVDGWMIVDAGRERDMCAVASYSGSPCGWADECGCKCVRCVVSWWMDE